MDISDAQLRNIWQQAAQKMVVVQTNGGLRGDRIYFRLSEGSVQGTCLTDVKSGSAIALLTDKGNWYLLAEESPQVQSISNKTIEYRRTDSKKPILSLDAAILYSVPETVDETTAPNVTGEYTFFQGRCHPRLPFAESGTGIYKSLESCQSSNHIISASVVSEYGYYFPVFKTVNLGYQYDKVNVSAVITHPLYQNNYHIVELSFSLYSTFPTSISISSSINSDYFFSKQSGIFVSQFPDNRNSEDTYILGSSPYAQIRFYDYLFSNSIFNTTINLPAGNNYLLIPILFNVKGIDSQSYQDVNIFGQFQIQWNPPPEPVIVDNYYLKNSLKSSQDTKLIQLCSGDNLKTYLIKTPTETYINFIYFKLNNTNARFLKKFVFKSQALSFNLYEYPIAIPDNPKDWLNSLSNNYNSNSLLGSFSVCFSSTQSISNLNYYKGILYECDLEQLINDEKLDIILLLSNAEVNVKSQKLKAVDGTCQKGIITQQRIKLRSIGNAKATIIAISVVQPR